MSVQGIIYPDLTTFNGDQLRQLNLIMPEKCKFISQDLPVCSVIRPTLTQNAGAMAAVKFLTAENLFQGQSQAFFSLFSSLAVAADAAVRQG